MAGLVVSASAAARCARAAAWLGARRPDERVRVVGPTLEAAAEVARAAAGRAVFGWARTTLARAAAETAFAALAERGLAPVGGAALEAVCARVVFALGREGRLGRFAAIAEFSGLPRALSRTLVELRLAGVSVDALAARAPDLAACLRAYEAELARAGLADRAEVFRLAAPAARALPGAPLLLVDVPVHSVLERELVRALAARGEVLATVPAGDARTLEALADALGVAAEDAGGDAEAPAALGRLQNALFGETAMPAAPSGDDVTVFSAPGESRECVEIARRIRREAEGGVPFDRMAVLLRAPESYRAHLEEAFRRAGVPAYFARGAVRPDPAGRAFLALLGCAAEGLSARRFAEYLSLGEAPETTPGGEPPRAEPSGERWVPPDEEMVVGPHPPDETDQNVDETIGCVSPVSAPRRWEQIIVDAAVIGGRERWARRLDGLRAQIELSLSEVEKDNEALADRLRRRLAELASLRRFALPLLDDLHALPARAPWGEWTEKLTALASRALRRPERVLSVLAELLPMGEVGPVDLAEVRVVLGRRLDEVTVKPSGRRYGRVFVAPCDAARGLSFDVVFVPGLAERMFPQKVAEDPLLRDADRAALGAGLATNEDRVGAERLALRLGVGAARRRVVLSYPRVDLSTSRPRVPSFYGLEALRAAEGALPGFDAFARRAESGAAARLGWPAPERADDAVDEAEYDLARLHELLHGRGEAAEGAARYLVSANPHLQRALRARYRRWRNDAWTGADGLVNPDSAAREALASQALSARPYAPTALESFAACPYRFFLRAIVRLEPREVPEAIEEMDPLQRGRLVHDVQFRLLAELREAGLLPLDAASLPRALGRLDFAVDAVAARYRDDLAPAIARVWEDGVAAVRADLREWLRRLAAWPLWTPWRFELAFGLPGKEGHDAASSKDPVQLDAGVKLRGAIDLVERDAEGALRATDHKTGKARVPPGSVVNGGRALQPVLYALALEKMFPGVRVEGGRLFYCTFNGGFEEVEIPLDDRARAAATAAVGTVARAVTRGFLPAAPERDGCRFCDYRAVCGPHEERRTRAKDRDALAELLQMRGMP